MIVDFSDDNCSDDRFNCQNGKCISMYLRCDAIHHCENGSDERNCSGEDIFHVSVVMFIISLY